MKDFKLEVSNLEANLFRNDSLYPLEISEFPI